MYSRFNGLDEKTLHMCWNMDIPWTIGDVNCLVREGLELWRFRIQNLNTTWRLWNNYRHYELGRKSKSHMHWHLARGKQELRTCVLFSYQWSYDSRVTLMNFSMSKLYEFCFDQGHYLCHHYWKEWICRRCTVVKSVDMLKINFPPTWCFIFDCIVVGQCRETISKLYN